MCALTTLRGFLMMPSRVGSRLRTFTLFFLVLSLGGGVALAQPAAPRPPKEYKVVIRYRIRAPRNDRIAQFFAMTGYFESLGFRKDPGPDSEPEDADQTRMTGTIASANARKLLVERHVRALLLIPADYELPAEGDKRVKVQLELTSIPDLPRQRLLASQLRAILERVGFREAVGYDNRGHTRLMGTLPAGRIDLLLQDLRWQGSGWLAPETPVVELPAPIRSYWPLLVTEVLRVPEEVVAAKELPPVPPVAAGQEYLTKIAPDLRALESQQEPVRMEVIFASARDSEDRAWNRALAEAVPGLAVEGFLGLLVTLKARPKQAEDLAQLPDVISVRLPRPASYEAIPLSGPPVNVQAALKASGLDQLHARGALGKGVRVAVIDADFRGTQQVLKRLPAKTRYVDLTAECNPNIEPMKFSGEESAVGRGTQCALAVALAAPEAELTLIRVNPETPYQLQAVARYIAGEAFRTVCLEQRNAELVADNLRLEKTRENLLQERKTVLDNFKQDKASVEQREAYFKRQQEFEQQEQQFYQRRDRYLKLQHDLQDLKGIPIVACSLVWNEGYPVDGSSALSRFFGDKPFRPGLWLQAAGDVRGQVWSGLFRDRDGNDVMEFAPAEAPLKRDRWTAELNFFGWQPFGKQAVPDLPKGKLRVTVQWREPNDPSLWGREDDPYRIPLANLTLVVLRQRDPTGTQVAADDLEVVARSVPWPLRLQSHPTSTTYEQSVEFTVETPGRYALRVEGHVPASVRPAGEPTLPSLETMWELRPRLLVTAHDEASPKSGRPIFWDYATDAGSVGMPADAHLVASVGAADLSGSPRPYSAGGPVFNQDLSCKPNVLAFDGLAGGLGLESPAAGTGLATAFAAGLAASATSAGIPPHGLLRDLHVPPGGLLRTSPSPYRH
jgi:hypothetical protein